MADTPPDGDRQRVVDLISDLIQIRRRAIAAETAQLRSYFANQTLPDAPTSRVRAKHGKHVEDDQQWPNDTPPEEFLESLRDAVLDPRGAIYLVEDEDEQSWTLYFFAPVPYHSRGPQAGYRIVVLFNAEHLFWITGFQAEASEGYVDYRPGFWVTPAR